MADFYQILGIDRSADSTQLRAAYKRLAFEYHPDRNPGNPQAEEMFKVINEAYHVLSDPLKKSRYDSRMSAYSTYADTQYWQEMQRQRYYRWKASEQPRYRFDKEYFRIQGLAFLTFLIIAGFCFGLINIVNYYYEAKQAEIELHNKKLVMKVNSLFDEGQVKEAFSMIKTLRESDPMEYQFYVVHDSLLNEVRSRAEKEFMAKHFSESLHYLEIIKQEEFPVRIETLKKISVCEYQSGDYAKALESLKQLFEQQPWNIELLYQIALIEMVHLNNIDEALNYLTQGKQLFKQNMTRIYGRAFEIVMLPEDVQDVYFDIFKTRAQANLTLKNFSEAEKDCNWAIFLRPQFAEPYKLRVISKVNQNIYRGICTDLAMAKKLGDAEAAEMQRKYCTNQHGISAQ